jgi:hypothetical protein
MKYFMIHWSIYGLFVPDRDWKRECFQIMIFVNVCSTRSISELKTRFETWITRNDVNGVSLFILSYLITLMVYLCSERTPNAQIKNFMFDWSIYRLFVLNTGCKLDSLHILIFVYVCFARSMVQIKTRFQTWITKNYVIRVIMFHLSYLITIMAYLWSQWTPTVQIKFFMFHWSIYRLFVLNRGWKRNC